MAPLLKFRLIFTAVSLLASTSLLACGSVDERRTDQADPAATTSTTVPGPAGEIAPRNDVSIRAPGNVRPSQTFRIEIVAPVRTRTAYVYWQASDGKRWTTFAFTTNAPEEQAAKYLNYPVDVKELPTVDLVVPETSANPTFQMTIAPPQPGHYRMVKAFSPPEESDIVWAGAEIDVVTPSDG